MSPSERAARWWALGALALSLAPVLGVFTTSRIFFVRDLGLFFWSRHLWLRHAVRAGAFPLWDTHVAAGQSAIADALNQLLMPVTLAIRLMPSDVVSFNLWVALPLPVAAGGMWLFLTRRHEPPAAFLGTVAFTLAGPTVSSLNAPNLSWSIALLPWVLWAAVRACGDPRGRTFALASAIVALQALAGEPVTLAATAVAALVTVPRPRAARNVLLVCGTFAAGTTLAAAQLLPTMSAGMEAGRGALSTPDFWSLHPLAFAESVLPHLFGNYYDAFLADMPWMSPLNSGREPFYYSIYVGPLTLVLALAALVFRPRRAAPWAIVALAFACAAMGGYTPLYPLARRILPGLAYFRFPVKYIAMTAFALAVLAADGWSVLRDGSQSRRVVRFAAGLGIAAAAAALLVIAAVQSAPALIRVCAWLARRIGSHDVPLASTYLARMLPPLAARCIGLVLAGSALIALAARRTPRASTAAWVLAAAMCVDLAVTNGDLNPTSPVARMTPPAWYQALAGDGRIYVGGRVRGYMNASDPDGTSEWEVPAEPSAVEGRLELNAFLPMMPSGWGVREALSYDLPVLWPAEYEAVVRRFERSVPTERSAFLRRAGVRWCVLPEARGADGPVHARVPQWHMNVVECNPSAVRALITDSPEVGADDVWQREALFDTSAADTVLRVAALPRVAGVAGPPAPRAVRVTAESANRLDLEASLDREAFLLLRDSYDPSWRATVDGMDADEVRANGLYRALRLPPGPHVIRFEYRPLAFRRGLIVSGAMLLVLMVMTARGGPARRSGAGREERGFTLVELMIVISIIGILLALAFARFHHMRAAGDEASAIASLRAITAAEWQFAQTCGNQKYAPTLVALGQPVPATGQPFLGPDLTAAEVVHHSGFDIRVVGKPLEGAPPACNGAAVSDGYAATADPAEPGMTGVRFFAINTDRVMYEDPKETFTDKMPETGAPAHGNEVK